MIGKGKMASKRSKMGGSGWAEKREEINKEGSLDSNWVYEARFKDTDLLKRAVIIEIKPNLNKLSGNKAPGPDNYKYFIHYLKTNRRLDRWVEAKDMSKLNIHVSSLKHEDYESSDKEDGGEHINHEVHENETKVKNISKIFIGKHWIETGYFTPLPQDYMDDIFFCETCLLFFKSMIELERHTINCEVFAPPGDQIYKDTIRTPHLAMFEIDGAKSWVYCENLAYISKMFLDHKMLGQRMEQFVFYVLFEFDEKTGYHVVGYFSRSKSKPDKPERYGNLSCIMVLPPYSDRGYGKLLIALSYELCLIEQKTGTPERPISDLGLKAFQSFWKYHIATYLLSLPENKLQEVTYASIAKSTGIAEADVSYTFEQNKMCKKLQDVTYLCLSKTLLQRIIDEVKKKPIPVIRENIMWTAYKIK